ncbi:hypothetical protein PMAYCL1PPCAC_09883, partial [Pristionchus mayeri]
NKEKEHRSGRHIRVPVFDDAEHPRPRKKDSQSHELIRGRGSEQRESPVKSPRSTGCPKKISEPRNDKTAPMASAQSNPLSSEAHFTFRRRSQMIIITLSLSLLCSIIVIIIQRQYFGASPTDQATSTSLAPAPSPIYNWLEHFPLSSKLA